MKFAPLCIRSTTEPNPNICTYTWMCRNSITPLAIHATDTGYSIMAGAFEQAAGY
ncbi:MAG TPA: hypothetical protein VF458_18095 [Ktedonobacteraceae bacterium]